MYTKKDWLLLCEYNFNTKKDWLLLCEYNSNTKKVWLLLCEYNSNTKKTGYCYVNTILILKRLAIAM